VLHSMSSMQLQVRPAGGVESAIVSCSSMVPPKGASAYEKAGVWSHISFSWVTPLIQRGWHSIVFKEDDAQFLMPTSDDASQLAETFEAAYLKNKVYYHMGGAAAALPVALMFTYLRTSAKCCGLAHLV